jgi:phenylalanyl-tRNA synthetase beta chain
VPLQGYRLGVVLYRRGAKTPDDVSALFRRAKGVVEHLLARLGLGGAAVREAWAGESRPWMHPRATVAVEAAGRTLGWLTRVHPGTLGTLEVTGAVVLAELDVEALAALPVSARRFQAVPRFPSMQADLSLIVDERALAGTFEAALRRTAGEHLASLELVSVYQGDPIPAGRKSLTFRLTFQAPDRTLSDAEVKAALDRATAEVKAAGATLLGL